MLSPYLGKPSFFSSRRNFGGISVEHSSVLFAVLLVLGPDVSLSQRPIHPHFQGFLQVPRVHRYYTLRADTDWYVVE